MDSDCAGDVLSPSSDRRQPRARSHEPTWGRAKIITKTTFARQCVVSVIIFKRCSAERLVPYTTSVHRYPLKYSHCWLTVVGAPRIRFFFAEATSNGEDFTSPDGGFRGVVESRSKQDLQLLKRWVKGKPYVRGQARIEHEN